MKIEIYTKSYCPFCHRAKALLDAKGLKYKEIEVSNNINELVHFFLESRNYSTFNFLQWFVAEQHEEENLFRGLIEKAELLSSEQNGGFWLDKELGELASSIKKI